MNLVLWIASVLLLLFGGYIIVVHWAMAYCYYVLKHKSVGSMVPLIGGVTAFLGILLMPIDIAMPHRLVLATAVGLFDLNFWFTIPWFLWQAIRGFPADSMDEPTHSHSDEDHGS